MLRRVLRWALRALAVATALVAVAATLGYCANTPTEAVPATVIDDPSLPRFELEEVTLHGEARGDEGAPVAVVLHGGPGADYRALLPLEALTDRYRVVFYDQRGAGLSERVTRDEVSMEHHYADLTAIIDRFVGPDGQVRIVGHSWGAMLGIAYAVRHPDRVSHLVLAEPGFLTDEAGESLMESTNRMTPPLTMATLRAVWDAWFASFHVRGPDDSAGRDYMMWRLMTSDIPGHPIAGYWCNEDAGTGHMPMWRFGADASQWLIGRSTADDGTIDVDFLDPPPFPGPILVLTGSCNRLLGTAYQRTHHLPHLPGAELVEVEGAGHTMIGERSEASLAAIRAFLDRR
ncbi:MAG: alpha/beta fold hydrolase [Sandaracinaceae bacterium]